MKSDYKLAVLLSAYNGEKYIDQQIQSILKQKNIKNITLIIRNDGSTDSTAKILEKYSSNFANIKILNEHNIGLVKSFFKLLEYSFNEGFDYYAFCDQDDYWLPDKLISAVNLLSKEDDNIPLLYGSCSILADKNLNSSNKTTQKLIRPITFYNSAIQNICPGHTQVLNKKLAEKLLNNFSEDMRFYSQDLWITNVATVTGKIIFDNQPHVLYRMHGNNELGYGQGKISRLKEHIHRLKQNECKLMSLQLKEFIDCFGDYLTITEKEEMNKFFSSQKNIINRMKYSINTKLYRQTKKETLAFKILYIFGAYNI